MPTEERNDETAAGDLLVEYIGGACCGESAWLTHVCSCGELLDVGSWVAATRGFVRHWYRIERLEGHQAWAEYVGQKELTLDEVLGFAE
ncbi:MAG: hypothetical protein M3546_15180 [Actinomycetota bacterium]|nr:hypothetical protein [Actinomycetota bacterium]